jgi:hypothetical protein
VSVVFDLRDVRLAGSALIAAGAAVSVTGVHPTLVCPLRALTGVPCPLCGMTTSVEATLHGEPGAALAANPAGLVAVVGALLVLAVRVPRVAVPRVFLVGALAGMWLFELHRYGVL